MPLAAQSMTIDSAPRDAAALLAKGSFLLKKLGLDLGLGATPEQRTAFYGLDKEKMVAEIMTALKHIDAQRGMTAPAPAEVAQEVTAVPAPAAPAPAEQPAAAPAIKRQPRHAGSPGNTPTTVAPVPAGNATGIDLSAVLTAIQRNTEAIDDLRKDLSKGIAGFQTGIQTVLTAQTGIAKVLVALCEATMGMSREDLVAAALSDTTGIAEVIGASSPKGKD